MRQPKTVLFRLLTLLCLVATACGSSTTTLATESPDEPPATDSPSETDSPVAADGPVELPASISEQDLDEARAALNAARDLWGGLEPFAYTLSTGFEGINLVEIDFDENGEVIAERVVSGEADPEGWGPFPRSVDEAFALVDDAVERFETGQLAVPPGGECGNHFNAQFDTERGAVTYFDTLGPCDDGVGLRLEVRLPGEVTAVEEPQRDCDRTEFAGPWLSGRAAGTEPLAEDDGVNDEGGVGVVILQLDVNQAVLQSGDTIEAFGEWFCTETEIIGITENGEERSLATINADGTLTFGDVTLSRVEEE